MKANELKVTDLMVGDLVICYHPSRLKSFEKVSLGLLHTMQEQEHGHIKEDSPLFRIVEPIPLTPEILEKNGFKKDFELKGCYWRPDCRKYCIVKEIETWYFAFRHMGGGHICIYECNYVHQLQHALRLCGINKEIVV